MTAENLTPQSPQSPRSHPAHPAHPASPPPTRITQTIWIARHGNRLDFVNPDWFNTAPRRYDPPLSDDGSVQAEELADRLIIEPIQHIFASPFRRAVQTAHPLAQRLGLPLSLEWGICEWLNPEWMTETPETAPIAELLAEFPQIDSQYTSRTPAQYPEVNESECWQRSGATAAAIADHLAYLAQTEGRSPGDVLFVGHGATVHGMMRGFLAASTGVRAKLCCLTKIVRSFDAVTGSLIGVPRLELDCDTAHLSQTETSLRLN